MEFAHEVVRGRLSDLHRGQGRDNYDHRPILVVFVDELGYLKAVHYRHLEVNQGDIVGPAPE